MYKFSCVRDFANLAPNSYSCVLIFTYFQRGLSTELAEKIIFKIGQLQAEKIAFKVCKLSTLC